MMFFKMLHEYSSEELLNELNRRGLTVWVDEIDRLRSENAALTDSLTRANQDAAAVRLQLSRLQRPFTVTVKIPELQKGECSIECPFSGKYIQRCGLKVDVSGEDRPGPGCPRYQKPEAKDGDR